MTGSLQNKSPTNAGGAQVQKLTGRDLHDARRLSLFAPNDPASTELSERSDQGPVSRAALRHTARVVLANRRQRDEFFGTAMFGEPAWDMLLSLYSLEPGQQQSANCLLNLVGVSETTALRWIDYLEQQQLIQRVVHPTDVRAVLLALTDKARGALDLYLEATRRRDGTGSKHNGGGDTVAAATSRF